MLSGRRGNASASRAETARRGPGTGGRTPADESGQPPDETESKQMKLSTYIRNIAVRNYWHPRGRTDRCIGSLHSTPIVEVDGAARPATAGKGYWKTGFRNGAFNRTLYTPSTLRIEVGRDWVAGCETVEQWCRMSPESPLNRD